MFGIYSLADGISSFATLFQRQAQNQGLHVLSGIVGIGAGLIALLWPGITALALFSLIAIWAIILGAIELVVAISQSGRIEGDWALVLSGVLWIAFGVALLVWPGPGLLAVLSMIAAFAIIRGVMLIVAGARMRTLHERLTTTPSVRPVRLARRRRVWAQVANWTAMCHLMASEVSMLLMLLFYAGATACAGGLVWFGMAVDDVPPPDAARPRLTAGHVSTDGASPQAGPLSQHGPWVRVEPSQAPSPAPRSSFPAY